MASKKSYSRYFIILQEDEKGYALDRDKSSSGYVKLEKKNNKCKVSFYAQNINPGMEPYYMVLVCKEKSVKKLLVLGKLSISEQGKIDMSCEYDVDNIAGTKMSMQHIIGATVSKVIEKDIVSLMSGFMGSDMPKDWKKYELVKVTREDEVAEKEETKNVEPDKTREDPKIEQEEKVEESKKQESPRGTFDEYEKKIEENVKEEEIQSLPKEEVRSESESNDITNQDKSKENEVLSKEETEETEIEEIKRTETKEKEKKEAEKTEIEEVLNREEILDKEESLERSQEVIGEKAESEDNIIDEDDEFCNRYLEEFMEEPQMDFRYDENSEYHSFEDMLRKKKKCCCKKCTHEEMPIGRLGSYFKGLISCFDEIQDMGEEIPMCKWYKIPVEKLEDMYDCSHFDRYTIIYYPMICYYSYISKHKHYCIGYKCNKEGKLLYILYAIPGGKDRMCQPYGGRTGFVTWVPYKCQESGYWLMFYDFRKSSVVVPIRKK